MGKNNLGFTFIKGYWSVKVWSIKCASMIDNLGETNKKGLLFQYEKTRKQHQYILGVCGQRMTKALLI